MSLLAEAYDQGRVAALEKFAVALGGGVLRAPVAAAPTRTALKGMSFAPAGTNTAVQGQQAAVRAAQGGGTALPGMAQRAWGGLNRVAANPVGSMLMGTGLMMGVGKLMEPSNNQ